MTKSNLVDILCEAIRLESAGGYFAAATEGDSVYVDAALDLEEMADFIMKRLDI